MQSRSHLTRPAARAQQPAITSRIQNDSGLLQGPAVRPGGERTSIQGVNPSKAEYHRGWRAPLPSRKSTNPPANSCGREVTLPISNCSLLVNAWTTESCNIGSRRIIRQFQHIYLMRSKRATRSGCAGANRRTCLIWPARELSVSAVPARAWAFLRPRRSRRELSLSNTKAASLRPSRLINLRPEATAISTRSTAVGRSTELAERTSDVT
jgi:hypothetical protein